MILAGAAGLLVAAGTLSGCPGTLDPSLIPTTGTGGTNGSGGGNGSGGTTADCTGTNDGATIVNSQCTMVCHGAASAAIVGGSFDLTIDSTIKSRLVGVKSPGGSGSLCGGNNEPYLNQGSNPATGLLIQKILTNPRCSSSENPPCCGDLMPQGSTTGLSSTQQTCIIQWATTLTTQ